jgi:hypothetical protein
MAREQGDGDSDSDAHVRRSSSPMAAGSRDPCVVVVKMVCWVELSRFVPTRPTGC